MTFFITILALGELEEEFKDAVMNINRTSSENS